MFRRAFFSAVAVVAGSAMIASAAPKDDVVAAVKKLADGGNYSWKTSSEGGQFNTSSEGKTSDGLIYTKATFGDNTTETLRKGDKSVSKTGDGGWMTAEERQAAGGGGGRGFGGRGGFGAQAAPAATAAEALAKIPDFKKSGDSYTADVTGEGVRDFMGFGGRGGGRGGAGGAGGQAPPPITGGKATITVWIKDGAVVKSEYKVSGTISFNGNDIDLGRTTTTEYSNVGSTKIDVPADAKAKLG